MFVLSTWHYPLEKKKNLLGRPHFTPSVSIVPLGVWFHLWKKLICAAKETDNVHIRLCLKNLLEKLRLPRGSIPTDFRDITIWNRSWTSENSSIFPVFFYLGQNIQILEITQVPYYFVLICLKKIPDSIETFWDNPR